VRDYTDKALPAEGRVLIRELVVYTELGKPLSLLPLAGKPTARKAEWDEGRETVEKANVSL
jgi:hypothetical protein